MTITIGRPQPVDAHAIAEIQVAAWQARLAAFVPEWFVARFTVEIQHEKYLARIADPALTLLIARQADRVVGVIGSKPNGETTQNYQAYIFGFYVAPDSEKQGIGTALLVNLLAVLRVRHIASVIVYTFSANTAARKLYEKAGGILLPFTSHVDIDLDVPHVSYGFTLTAP